MATVVLDGSGAPPRTLRLTGREARTLLDGDRVSCVLSGGEKSITVLARCRTLLVGVVRDSERGRVLEIDPATGSGWVSLPKPAPTTGSAVVVEIGSALDTRARAVRIVAGPWEEGSVPHLRAAAFLRSVGRYPVESPLADPEMIHSRLLAALTDRTPNITAAPTPPGSPRKDLRTLGFVTIDGPSTRDIDDAVWAAPAGTGWDVKVAIADVASAVPAGSELDAWALAAATSVYLPGQTFPMLPPELSEDRCSLLPQRDRDAVVVSFHVTSTGEVSGIELTLATINSKARLTYDQVDDFLTGTDPSLPSTVRHCADAAFALGSAREQRNELPEMITPVLVGPVLCGDKVTVELQDAATPAHKLIEHLMVAANEAVGVFIAEHGSSALYRRQNGPAADPLVAELAQIAALWSELPGEDETGPEPALLLAPDADLTAAEVAAILATLPIDAAAAASSRVLRHLGRAFYGPGPGSHFHLGSTHYLHFTSPIRRYADLVVHRVVHAMLSGDEMPYSDEQLATLGDWVTARSAAADWAEAGTRRSLWALLLSAGLASGEEISALGAVSNIDRSAIMLRLLHLGVVSRAAGSHLPGFDPASHGLSAEDASGHGVRVGDEIVLRITAADPLSGDLTTVPAHPETPLTDLLTLSTRALSGTSTAPFGKEQGRNNRSNGDNRSNRKNGNSSRSSRDDTHGKNGKKPTHPGGPVRPQGSSGRNPSLGSTNGAGISEGSGPAAPTRRSRRGRRPRPDAGATPAAPRSRRPSKG